MTVFNSCYHWIFHFPYSGFSCYNIMKPKMTYQYQISHYSLTVTHVPIVIVAACVLIIALTITAHTLIEALVLIVTP